MHLKVVRSWILFVSMFGAGMWRHVYAALLDYCVGSDWRRQCFMAVNRLPTHLATSHLENLCQMVPLALQHAISSGSAQT